jgi:hypothetical protein
MVSDADFCCIRVFRYGEHESDVFSTPRHNPDLDTGIFVDFLLQNFTSLENSRFFMVFDADFCCIRVFRHGEHGFDVFIKSRLITDHAGMPRYSL